MKRISILLLIGIIGLTACQAGQVKVTTQQKIPLKIGAILPLSGPASYPGEQAKIGISLSVDEINAQGGIGGREVKVIYEDSQTNPTHGVSVFHKLVEVDKVDMVITALSSVSMAIAPLTAEKEIPIMGIMVTANDFIHNDWVFRYYPIARSEVEPIEQFIKNLNLQKIGVLYLNDEFGLSVFNSLKDALDNDNQTVVGESYDAKESNFQDVILKLQMNNIDSLYLVGFDSHLVKIIKSLKELGFKKTVISASPLSLPYARQKISDIDHKIYVTSPSIYLVTV